MNRIDRLLALILFLQSKRVITAEELAAHFELSVRTIYRDLAALGEAGVPIVAEAGVGYSLMKGYHLPPVNFTSQEASALVTGGILVEQFADASLKTHIQSALRKVRAVLPQEEQDRISSLQRKVTATANLEPVIQADLVLLQQSLAHRRLLKFRYQGAADSSPSERVVEPFGLIYYLGRWHLIAWCRKRNDYRDFRTDRMSDIIQLKETFTPRDEFSISDFIQKTMPKPALKARIKFSHRAADRAKREWWLGILNEEKQESSTVLTLATVDWDRLVGWLLSFGLEATVIEPPALQSIMVKTAGEIAAHHEMQKGKVS
jgi:predicted DNA-binding transcriptional regulator YafY